MELIVSESCGSLHRVSSKYKISQSLSLSFDRNLSRYNLRDFFSNSCLSGFVILKSQSFDDFTTIFFGRLHRNHTIGMFGKFVLEKR